MIDPIPMVGSMSLGYGDAAPPAPTGEGPDLKEACKDFISILYSYTFEQLRSTENDDNEEGLFNGQDVSMFMGFFDQEVGKNIANREGGELADLLYEQLIQNKLGKK